MKGLMAVGAVFLLAGRLLAQATQEDPVERDLQRLRRDLNLTDEQLPKAREILKKQSEDLRSILTDEQKRTLDQGGGGRGNRGGGNNQPGGTQSFRGGWYPTTDELKKDLSLTDDQVTKMNAVRDGVREEMRRLFQNRRGGGQDLQATMDKLRDDTTAKMRDVCTDDQKPKFDELIKAYRAQQGQGGGNRGAPGGGRGGPSVDERVNRVMETLKVDNAAEADAIKGVVKKVIELMDKLDAHQRESRTKIEEASRNLELSDEAIGDRIDEVRKGQLDIEKELRTARKELADIVTNRQELELLRRGILR